MKNKNVLGLVLASITAISFFGIVGTLEAKPSESQRLRGLGDRVFLVTVTLTKDLIGIGLPIGTSFPNCYVFAADDDEGGNNWFETAFPTKGMWAQDSNGAKTSYTAENAEGFLQLGLVTPAGGKGVLQLVAKSFVDAVPGGDPAELEFLSVGAEIDESEIAGCPTEPDFTFPDPE
jgi:hypothetical protein